MGRRELEGKTALDGFSESSERVEVVCAMGVGDEEFDGCCVTRRLVDSTRGKVGVNVREDLYEVYMFEKNWKASARDCRLSAAGMSACF